MAQALQIASLLLIAVAWALAFAHAAEYPGKMRLERNDYYAAQTIYYPGFTLGGASEPLAIAALAALLAFGPLDGADFWLAGLALVATVATQAIFWLATQPVNRIWARELKLGKAGERFFAPDARSMSGDWTELRDRWETSHLARAALMSVALIALVVAVTL
jgi:hypothetical protein